jgi:hypothetical protein
VRPGCYRRPNPLGERDFEEEVLRCFQASEVERTEICIGQTYVLEAISTPQAIVEQQPKENFALGRGQGDQIISGAGESVHPSKSRR